MTGTLVGRGAECAALHSQIEAAAAGKGLVILVAGEAGAGKTALVDHVLDGDGLRVLRGRATEWSYTAYDPIAMAIRPLLPPAGERPAALAQLFPEPGVPQPEQQPAALVAAVCSQLAGTGPTALFLDDLQWADEATLALLPPLADALRGLPVVVVGCYRSDELPRGHSLRTVRAQLRRTRQLAEIGLGPLADADVTDLLTALLGAAPQPTLAALVASRADGLPFAVEELAFALRDAGRLVRVGDAFALAGAGAGPVPDGVREAVLLRSARLSDQERALLQAAAVAGLEFDVDTVLPASGVAVWPDGFTGSGLVTDVADGRAAFRHSLTREAIYADIPWTKRRRLHRDLATALTGARAAPALIAAHLLAAKDYGPASRALVAAAQSYWTVHAYRDAARALRAALDHWPPDADDEGRIAAIDQLARCSERCSEYTDAVSLLRELAEEQDRTGDVLGLAGTHRRLALVHELRGQWEFALAEREQAAANFCAAGSPAEAAIDRLAIATHLRAAASYSAALATLNAASADAEAGNRPDLQLRVLGLRGNLLCRLGNPAEGIAAVRTALDQALTGSMTDTAAELHQRLADGLEHSGDYRAATAAYAAAYQYCDAHGADAVGEICRACATAVLFASGDWDRVLAVTEDILGSAALPQPQAIAHGMAGLVHALRGAVRAARRELAEAILIATRIELTPVQMLALWGLAILEDAAGNPGEAADRARQVLALISRTQERHYGLIPLPWMSTFFAQHELATECQRCAAALSEIAEATGTPEAIAALAHARGETLLAEQPGAAARELCRAAEMFRQLDLPLATAFTSRRAAKAALLIGETRTGRELLHVAHDAADRLAATNLRDGCRAALAELGERSRRRGGQSRNAAGLSGRELDVMLIVAEGKTSKQAGAALFISPRTVEMHVQSSLLKLGCRTRADAVRRLAELGVLPAGR
jgi:DNA-binding CsgD family transcriptional regulator